MVMSKEWTRRDNNNDGSSIGRLQNRDTPSNFSNYHLPPDSKIKWIMILAGQSSRTVAFFMHDEQEFRSFAEAYKESAPEDRVNIKKYTGDPKKDADGAHIDICSEGLRTISNPTPKQEELLNTEQARLWRFLEKMNSYQQIPADLVKDIADSFGITPPNLSVYAQTKVGAGAATSAPAQPAGPHSKAVLERREAIQSGTFAHAH